MQLKFQILAVNAILIYPALLLLVSDYGPSLDYVYATEWHITLTYIIFHIIGSYIVAIAPTHIALSSVIGGPLITMSRKSVLSDNPIKIAFIFGLFGGMLLSSVAHMIIVVSREIVRIFYKCFCK